MAIMGSVAGLRATTSPVLFHANVSKVYPEPGANAERVIRSSRNVGNDSTHPEQSGLNASQAIAMLRKAEPS